MSLTDRPRGASPERKKPLSTEFRATIYYFVTFMTMGAGSAYGGIWLQSKGLTPVEIGIIGSLPVLIMLVANLAIGRIADRADDWRQVIVVGALLAAVIPIGLFFAHGFIPLLVIFTATALPLLAIGPVQDAATIRMTNRTGGDFGVIRAWATVGFTATIVITGQLVTWFGSGAYVPFLVALGLLRGVAALGLPNFRAPKEERTLAVKVGATRLGQVMKAWFLLPLIGWAMVYATHLALDSFQALLWQQQGIPDLTIALLIGVGAAAEAGMMFVFKRFVGRYPARLVILISALVSAARWAVTAFAPSVPVLFALQLLHSVTFGLGFMGCVHFIANWTSEDIAAEAQSFFQLLMQATSVLTIAAFGWVVSGYGIRAYFALSAIAAFGAVLIFISMRLMAPKQQGAESHA